jgi:hypothetical protein
MYLFWVMVFVPRSALNYACFKWDGMFRMLYHLGFCRWFMRALSGISGILFVFSSWIAKEVECKWSWFSSYLSSFHTLIAIGGIYRNMCPQSRNWRQSLWWWCINTNVDIIHHPVFVLKVSETGFCFPSSGETYSLEPNWLEDTSSNTR